MARGVIGHSESGEAAVSRRPVRASLLVFPPHTQRMCGGEARRAHGGGTCMTGLFAVSRGPARASLFAKRFSRGAARAGLWGVAAGLYMVDAVPVYRRRARHC